MHATQCFGYLRAYQRYHSRALTEDQIAQYLKEYQQILLALGGEKVQWQSWADLIAYLESKTHLLEGGHRVEEVYKILCLEARQGKNASVAGRFFLNSALDLVPNWGQSIFKYSPSFVGVMSRTAFVRLVACLLRWASMESAAKQAWIRVSTD